VNRILEVNVLEQGNGRTRYRIASGGETLEEGWRGSYAAAVERAGRALQEHIHERGVPFIPHTHPYVYPTNASGTYAPCFQCGQYRDHAIHTRPEGA
jgi:hypothetical protein